MSDLEPIGDVERDLRRAFHREPLPVAPDRLRDALTELVEVAPARAGRRRGPATWTLLGVAAVLALGGALAVIGAGAISPPPALPLPSAAPVLRITYAVTWSADDPATDATRAALVGALERRLGRLDVATPRVTSTGSDQVVVELPVPPDPDRVRRILGQVGAVSFVPVAGDPPSAGDVIDPGLPVLFGAEAIESASSTSPIQVAQPVVSIQLTRDGTATMATWTRTHVGSHLAIVIDGRVVLAPRIQAAIEGGSVEIMPAGDFDAAAIRDLVTILDAGPLPVPIREVSAEP